jgi:hypothetical protein
MWLSKQKTLVVLLASLSLGSGACSYGTFFIPKQQKAYAPTDPDSIAVSPQQDLGKAYERLGRVAVIVWGSGDGARASIQDQASKLGANAVIDFKLERAFGRTAASGLAVKVFSK